MAFPPKEISIPTFFPTTGLTHLEMGNVVNDDASSPNHHTMHLDWRERERSKRFNGEEVRNQPGRGFRSGHETLSSGRV